MIATPAPATEAQTSFIADLITKRDLTDAQRTAARAELAKGITKDRASIVISYLKARPFAPRAVTTVAGTDMSGLPKSRYALVTDDLEGLTGVDLASNNLLFVEIQEGRNRWKGRLFLNRLTGAPGDFTRTRFNSNDAAIIVAALRVNPLEAAQRFGAEYTCCGKCGAPLTDEESRRIMLGPVCKGAFGL